jgi:hypothetical protein
MRRLATWTVVLGMLGCRGKTEQAKPADPEAAAAKSAAAATPSAGAALDGSPPAAAVAGPPDAAPAPFLPPSIDEKSGIIFADKPGGTVKGIKDGTPVAVVGESETGVGSMADSTVTIKVDGKKLTLGAGHVLRDGTVDAIHRSPDNKHAVFAPIVACGDMCHTELWMINATDGTRVKLGEGGPDVNVAWHPKGGTAAVGSASLWIVSLADYKVKALDDFLSPSYSPDGTLYARAHDGDAFTIGKGKPVRVWDAGDVDPSTGEAKVEGEDDDEEVYADAPKPVEFVDGKPDYDLAHFPH